MVDQTGIVPAGAQNYAVQAPSCPAQEWTASVGGAAVDPASGVHSTGDNLYNWWMGQQPNVLFTNTGTTDAQVRVWVNCQWPY